MEENIPEIETIIADYLAGTAGEAAKKYLDEWLSTSPDNRERFEVLKTIWLERSSDPVALNKEEALNRIWEKGLERGHGSKRLNFYFLSKLAAAFVLFVLAPLISIILWKSQPEEAIREVYIVKENPVSERSRFTLPDGSMVWLNSASSLRYLENFTSSAREVELIGEAFFEVTKDPLRSFVVRSGNLSTTALGTSFNVAAYPEKDLIEVALVSGKVSVDDNINHDQLMVLNPGMGMRYDRTTKRAVRKRFNADMVLGWKNGVLIFEGDNFEEFRWKIEHWYGVKVDVQGKVPDDWQIRGRFDNEYLTSVLEVISFNKDFKFTLNNKQLTLVFK